MKVKIKEEDKTKKRILSSFVMYPLVGAGGICLSFFIMSFFIEASYSQTANQNQAETQVTQSPTKTNQSEEDKETNQDGEEQQDGEDVVKLPGEDYELFLEPYNYDPSGRRDPFIRIQDVVESDIRGSLQRPLLPLERYDLDEIELIGIIWKVNNPRAMFLDPTNKVHVLGANQRIGRNQGYIAVIREGEVIVVETSEKNGELTYQTKVLRIKKESS